MPINLFYSHRNPYPITRLRRTAPWARRLLRPLTYRQLFARAEVPAGTCIFTDFDFLNSFELDAAGRAARAALAAGARVLNRPWAAAERIDLLTRLHTAGLNPVEVWRIDCGERPTRWPVFLRAADGASGADTELLPTLTAFDTALAALCRQGHGLRRRIAVSFEATPDADGFYRKYGAFVIGDHIIPQHILRGRHWMVKSRDSQPDDAFAEEERAYVEDNPHAATLLEVARIGAIDFARVDYGLRDGRIVVYEMNTHPTFPRFTGGSALREARRGLIAERLQDALGAVAGGGGPARFCLDGIGNPETLVERAHWLQDLPRSLLERQRWQRALRQLRGAPR